MGLGTTELIVILVIALVVFGPSKLPGLGKSMGEAIRGFKKAMNEDENEAPKKREQISPSDSTASTTETKQKDKV